ncbi:MAG: hypothetical protein LBC06_01525 [Rickettsiales bacterium]|jgi:hypothetical protein|nr:hypothetical protein [Rickettsiales bacterium]
MEVVPFLRLLCNNTIMLSKSDLSLANANLYAVYLDMPDNVVGNLNVHDMILSDNVIIDANKLIITGVELHTSTLNVNLIDLYGSGALTLLLPTICCALRLILL